MSSIAKHSRRIPRGTALVLVALLSACATQSTGPGEPTVDEVRIAPASVSIFPGQQTTLTATALTATDSVVTGRTFAWSSSNTAVATVSAAGVASAVGLGSTTISASTNGKTGSATLTVSAASLLTLVLTPPSASVNTGATQQFAVAGTWSDGGMTPPAVVYTATGGTISVAGLFTAGGTPGSFRAIAVHQGGTRADTSTITVTAPGGALVNECASPEPGWIWCDDFDVDRLSSYFEHENPGGSFTRVNGVGNDGSYGMRAHWNAGQVSAGALHLAVGRTPQAYFRAADAGTADYRELYWRVYLRNQVGWTGGGGDKLARAFVFASSTSWAQAAIAHVWAGDDNSAFENVLMVDPARGTDAGGTLVTTGYNDFAHLTWLGLVRGTNALFAPANVGVWRCIEARARLNDAGSSNGVMEIWIDGTLDVQKTGLNFLGAFNAYGLNAVFLENYWNNGSPAAQDRFFDNFVVSTQRIGC